MSANANDTIDTIHRAGREAAGDLRRRAGAVRDCATDELRSFIADVEDLVQQIGATSDSELARARTKVANAIGGLRRLAGDTGDTPVTLKGRAREAARRADGYVHERPWPSIGLAAAIGLLVGCGVTAAATRR